MLLRTLTLLCVCSTLAACSRPNPAFCDQASDCAGALDFCDYDGLDGLAKTCVADPQDQSCNLAEVCTGNESACKNDPGDGLPGICVDCLTDNDCDGAAPFCDVPSNTCQTPSCTPGETGDAQCLIETPATPVCGPNDRCVECNTSSDCAVNNPACDPDTHECRKCEAHTECESGACDIEDGTCLLPANIAYVKNGGNDAGPCTIASPCETMNGGIAKVSGNIETVVVLAGVVKGRPDGGEAQVNGKTLTIVGQPGASLEPNIGNGQAGLDVVNGAVVTISSLRIASNLNGSQSIALGCDGSTLTVEDSVIEMVDRLIRSQDCSLTVLRSELRNAQTQVDTIESAIRVNLGGISLLQSKIVNNPKGGVHIESANFEVVNCLFAQNGNSSSDNGAVKFTGASMNHRFDFNTLADNQISTGSSEGSALDCSSSTADLDAANNIISFGDAPNVGVLVRNCSVQDSVLEGVTAAAGNINEKPSFVSGYHLAPTSPGVDDARGGGDVRFDLEGDDRPQGMERDMGMDEVLVQSP